MGLMQRRKGRAYEQAIARTFRERWPDCVVRRASQAERADNPDVFIADGPELLKRMWLELTDGRAPDPSAKLAQAEGDIAHRTYHRNRLPIVVWHRLGARKSFATTRLWVIDAIRGQLVNVRDDEITMTLDSLLDIVDQRIPRATEAA